MSREGYWHDRIVHSTQIIRIFSNKWPGNFFWVTVLDEQQPRQVILDKETHPNYTNIVTAKVKKLELCAALGMAPSQYVWRCKFLITQHWLRLEIKGRVI